MIDVLGIMLLSNVWAPWKLLGVPSFKPLRITSTYRGGGGLSPLEWNKWWYGKDDDGQTIFKEVPPMFVVSGVNGEGREWDMAIDLTDNTVGVIDWADMTHYRYGGSGELGFFVFGIPGIILTSPLWLTTNFVQAAVKRLSGLDFDHWSVWLKLLPQLERWGIDKRVVLQALKNHCAGVENKHNARRIAEHEERTRESRLQRPFADRKDDICDGPFMVRYAAGCAEPTEINNDYADWGRRRAVDSDVTLPEWLGMTTREFSDWVLNNKTVDQILEGRDWR